MVIFNNTTGSFPQTRLRRLRSASWLRDMVQENYFSVKDLILPIFVQEGTNKCTAVESMPGVNRLSVDKAIDLAKEAYDLGIPAVALFPVVATEKKSEKAEEAYNNNNLICSCVSKIKEKLPDLGIICDVALDPYTSHGQDGLVKDNKILNDQTVDVLCKQAVSLAKAGCDIVAPSDMMDGRVKKIREHLDNKGYSEVAILAYSAKYASSFYGPFRDAVGSSANLGHADKKTYQMNPANLDEALREVALDIQEGADMVMVKPGMPYLDVVRTVCDNVNLPVLAYHVSGEYAMVKAAEEKGWLDGNAAFLETILSFKRAGATAILTYAAIDIAMAIR